MTSLATHIVRPGLRRTNTRLGARSHNEEPKYLADRIKFANAFAVEKLLSVKPMLVDVDTALSAVPGMTPATILHAGPPIEWHRMCPPMKRAVVGAAIFEGLASSEGEAQSLVNRGKVKLSPNHHHDAVGPMTGVISASMPVIATKDAVSGRTAYSTFNEGAGAVLWFGVFQRETLERLRWIKDVLAPVMKQVIRNTGGVPVWPILAQAIQMGDECHNRHAAATNLFLKGIVEQLFTGDFGEEAARAVYRFIAGNSHFFLNVTMTGCKLAAGAAHGVTNSTIATAMSRNGTDFGIRVSGLGDEWFTAPAPYLRDALYNPGYGPADGAPDIGDSAIIETTGLGGSAIAAAPAMASLAGGGFEAAREITKQIGMITVAKNPQFPIPSLDFEGVPSGIDVRKVVETGILPNINSAVIHKDPGVGQIGVGIAKAPFECFVKALIKFGAQAGLSG